MISWSLGAYPSPNLQIAEDEIALAKELYVLTAKDSRAGFESTNQYCSYRSI